MNTTTTNKQLTFTRVINARRELVFKVWLDPIHLARWWGPKDFTNPVCEVDAKPGGAIFIEMTAPDGTAYPTKGTFHEIDEPNKLVFTTSAHEDAQGNPGIEVLNTVTFEDVDGKTKLTLHAFVVKVAPAEIKSVEGMEQGWNQSLDRLIASVE